MSPPGAPGLSAPDRLQLLQLHGPLLRPGGRVRRHPGMYRVIKLQNTVEHLIGETMTRGDLRDLCDNPDFVVNVVPAR